MKPVAFFDIDGTILECDTFQTILKIQLFHSPWRLLLGLIVLPVICIKKGGVNRTSVKSSFLWAITFNKKNNDLLRLWRMGKEKSLPHIYKEIKPEIKKLKQEGFHICYTTASSGHWIKGIIDEIDERPYTLISTRLKPFFKGYIIDGANNYGDEKVKRILSQWPDGVKASRGYTDSPSDAPFLKLCSQKFVINSNSKIRSFFRKKIPDTHFLSWTKFQSSQSKK